MNKLKKRINKKRINAGATVRVIDDLFQHMLNRVGVVVHDLGGGYRVRFQGPLPDDSSTIGDTRIFLDEEIVLVPPINELLKKYYDIR